MSTFAASPARLARANAAGWILPSGLFIAAALIAALPWLASWLAPQLVGLAADSLAGTGADRDRVALLASVARRSGNWIVGFAGMLAGIVLLGHVVVTRGVWQPRTAVADLPAPLGRGDRMVQWVGRGTVALGVVATSASWLWLAATLLSATLVGASSAEVVAASGHGLANTLAAWLLLCAVLGWWFASWRHRTRLTMTHHEFKQEQREQGASNPAKQQQAKRRLGSALSQALGQTGDRGQLIIVYGDRAGTCICFYHDARSPWIVEHAAHATLLPAFATSPRWRDVDLCRALAGTAPGQMVPRERWPALAAAVATLGATPVPPSAKRQ